MMPWLIVHLTVAFTVYPTANPCVRDYPETNPLIIILLGLILSVVARGPHGLHDVSMIFFPSFIHSYWICLDIVRQPENCGDLEDWWRLGDMGCYGWIPHLDWKLGLSLKLWPFQDTNLIQPADSGTGPLVHHVSMDFLWRFSMFFPPISPIPREKLPGRLQIRASKPEMAAARRFLARRTMTALVR